MNRHAGEVGPPVVGVDETADGGRAVRLSGQPQALEVDESAEERSGRPGQLC